MNRRALNRRAGANLTGKERRGRHEHSKRWVAGDNWVTCQRCGHDVYASDAREDGYVSGLLVCPTCFDPPHPQDYVRAYQDRISPPSDMVTGSSTDTVAGPAGSTANPYSTSVGAWDGTVTAVSDQSDQAGATISTLVTSGCFFTSYYDHLRDESVTISSYSASGLPDSLSINTSTGDITGTLTVASFASTPYSVTVTATYASGVTQKCDFIWNVTDGGALPTDFPSLVLWWDMSDSSAVWANELRTTPITDGTLIRGCTDLSGNGHHGETEADGNAMRWQDAIRNSLAVADADIEAANPRQLNTGPGDSLALTQPYTIFATAQIPVADSSDANVLMSHRGINGTQMEQARIVDSGTSRLYTIVSSSVGEISDGDALGDNAGEWYMVVMHVNGDDTWITFNNLAETGQAEHDTNSANSVVSYRFAAGTDTSANIRTGWNAPVGETAVFNDSLTAQNITDLYTRQKIKWALTDEING